MSLTGRQLRRCLSFLLGASGAGLMMAPAWDASSESPPATKYPEAVLRLTGGRQPFTPQNAASTHELKLSPLRDLRRGGRYGSALKLTLKPLGEKLLLVDTAARGLLLRSAATHGRDIVSVPDWIQSGPGLQTGVFQLLERLSWRDSFLEPAVAELFQDNAFENIDGVIATEVFSPWLVRLDFRRNLLSLLPYPVLETGRRREWESELDLNWWVVNLKLGGRSARLLLDSGAAKTLISQRWLFENFPGDSRRLGSQSREIGSFREAGLWKIEAPGVKSFYIRCLCASQEQVPHSKHGKIDGVLGFDALRNLAFDIDYHAGKLYVLQ